MKKNKIYKTCMLLAMLLPISCSDEFLEQKKVDDYTEESLFQKEQDAVALVSAVYDVFHNNVSGIGCCNDYVIKGLWYQANFLSQDIRNVGADVFYETYEVPTTFQALEILWADSYAGIGRANAALVKFEEMQAAGILNEELATRLAGEVYFLRGVLYTFLASSFGGVPLVVEELSAGGDLRLPRNTEEETFAQVEMDMQAAAERLPWVYDANNLGRATKGAALAYMGEAQMWQGKYGEAVTTFETIVAEGPYMLETNYFDIHEPDNQNGIESIFEFQYGTSTTDYSWGTTDNTQGLSSFIMPAEVGGCGCAKVTPELYESFEEGDERRVATVIGPGEEHPSEAINISMYPQVQDAYDGINTLGTVEEPWDDRGGSGYALAKLWRSPDATGWGGTNIFIPQNLIVMRYAQVLLNLAEARLKSGDEGGALEMVNIVRDRAGLEDVDASDGAVIDLILTEYRHELAGEFSLWWILRRSGEARRYVLETYGITIPTGKELLPIPQSEIDINQNLEQNPGY